MTQPSRYAKRLDRTRDFGTYCPPDSGAFHNQDGIDFDHEGYVVEGRLTPEQRERLAKKSAPKPPAPAAKQQQSAAAGGEGGDGGEGSGEGNANADGLNLEMWLRGEEDYPFPDVQKAVKARMSVWKTAKRDLILFLLEEQVIPADQLSDELKGLIA